MKHIIAAILLMAAVSFFSCESSGADDNTHSSSTEPEPTVSTQQDYFPPSDPIPEPTETPPTEPVFTEPTGTTEPVSEGTTTGNDTVEALDVDVPILMYHTSSESEPGALSELYVKPSEFEKQLIYLKENGFTFCTFDDYENLAGIEKPIMITFDDGYVENYTEIYPLLKKYDAKITLFLILSSVGENASVYLTEETIKEMSDSGLVKVESHTMNHYSLPTLSDDRLDEELRLSKEAIEAITGKPVLALAYPAGDFDERVKEAASEYYTYALRKDKGMHNTAFSRYEVRRIRINRSTAIDGFIYAVNSSVPD